MKSAAVAIVVCIACSAGAGQAMATPITFTYKGTVTTGADQGGFFGSAGTNLAGKSFDFVETFDVAKADGATTSPYFSSSFGGSNYAGSKLKIGSSAFFDITGGETYNYSSSGAHSSWQFVADVTQVGTLHSAAYTLIAFQANAPALTAGDAPVEIAFAGPAYGGTFFTSQYSYDSATYASTSRSAYANFNLQSLTISSVSAVPLPASAPMFGAALLGLGAIGSGVRRRRSAVTA